MRHLHILVIIVLCLSCNSSDKKAKIIPRNDFINLLADIHLYDALSTDYSLSEYFEGVDSVTLYRSIFAKYGVSSESFSETMAWYSSRPEKFDKLYDEVFGKVNKLNQELTDKQALFAKPGSKLIFKLDRNIFVVGDTANYPDPFLIPVSEKGTYLITAQIRFQENDESVQPKIVCYLLKTESDDKPKERQMIADFPLQKTNFSREYQFIAKLDNKDYKFLKIILPQVANDTGIYRKNFQLNTLRVNLISDEKTETPEMEETALNK